MTASSSHWASCPEFVACILASSVGTRLFPMASEKLPKHMLPVAGFPVLFRLLATLEASGFTEAVIAVRADDAVTTREALLQTRGEGLDQSVLHPYKAVAATHAEAHHDAGGGKESTISPLVLKSATMKVTVLSVSTTTTVCSGTAEALRRVEASGVIPETSHIVVFPGDLVFLNAEPLREMIHAHRRGLSTTGGSSSKFVSSSSSQSSLPASCTVLLADVGEVDEQGHPLKESAKQKKGLLARDEEEIDYIAVTSDSRLVWKQSKLDVEEDKMMVGTTPKLVLPKARLRGGVTRVCTEWNDVHCYCLAPWVRRLLVARSSLQSIQYDLIPLLIARQFRGAEATFGTKVQKDAVHEALQLSPNPWNSKATPLLESATGTTMSRLSNVSIAKSEHSPTTEFAVLAHVTQASIFRSHTIAAYLYANREVAHEVSAIAAVHTATPLLHGQKLSNLCLALPAGASVKPKFHSLLLPDCTVADKVTFKSSVVGRNCKLGANCRLNNVVVQDNVTIGDNTILQNTIIGTNSTLGENCNLNDCQVCPGKVLPAGTKKKGEALIDDSL